MAELLGSDIEVGKPQIWKTDIPFDSKVRQSSYFSLMGLEWCLRFSYQGKAPFCYLSGQRRVEITRNVYHVISLHRVINGQVTTATADSGQQLLKEKFTMKTRLMEPTKEGSDGIQDIVTIVKRNVQNIWYAGDNGSSIFFHHPCLFKSRRIKVVCKFYGRPLSTFQLESGTGKQLPVNSEKLDKSVQVSPDVPLHFLTLSSDFSDMFEKKIFPDLKLECEGQTFQAHKSVLAARSMVFRAMFLNKMLENETGTVKIKDLGAPVLKKLLEFIYSGKLEELPEDNTADLYEAADKYDIVSLKTACSYNMVKNLNEGNCIRYLQAASSHSDTDLKAAVISFIIKTPSVLISEDWLTFSKKPSELAIEVFQAYIASTVR